MRCQVICTFVDSLIIIIIIIIIIQYFIVHHKKRYIGVTRIYLREVALYCVGSLTYTFHLYLKKSVFFDGSIGL